MHEPTDLHHLTERLVNAGDVDGLVALYEPEATVLDGDGREARGPAAIREAWATVVAFGGSVSMTTRHAVVVDDLALLSNDWVLTLPDGSTVRGRTAEVARRGADGTWRYVIDHPTAADDPVAA